ncbi:kinesin-like protein KIFC3 [Gastrophryne carolinensis]
MAAGELNERRKRSAHRRPIAKNRLPPVPTMLQVRAHTLYCSQWWRQPPVTQGRCRGPPVPTMLQVVCCSRCWILRLTPDPRRSGCWWCRVPLTMVGSLPQDRGAPPGAEGPQQRPPERPQRPLMIQLQETRALQEVRSAPGKRPPQPDPRELQRLRRDSTRHPKGNPESALPDTERALQDHLQRLGSRSDSTRHPKGNPETALPDTERALQDHLQRLGSRSKGNPESALPDTERALQERLQDHLQRLGSRSDSTRHPKGNPDTEKVLQERLQDMQEKLEQKRREHSELCRDLAEMRFQVEELSGLQSQIMSGTDLEKHRDLLVSENGRLRQELQLLRSRLGCSQEMAALQERVQRMEQEESERKTLICALQGEVQQKAERLAEAELRVRDSVRERVEEEERLKRQLREYQLAPQPQYVVPAVESGEMQDALSHAEEQRSYLQEQLDRHSRTLQEMRKRLQHEQQEAAKLRAQVALYAAELERVQEQMVQEFQALQQEKELAVEEAYDRAQEEMRAVHQSLDGVRKNLLMLQPALRTLTHDYNALKRQVRDFPTLLQDAMQEARSQFAEALRQVQEVNVELLGKYRRELQLRKECHNQLVRLRGNIRVLGRVRPITAEDGAGPGAEEVVAFDPDDDGILQVTQRGKTFSFELDRVFRPDATQEEVFGEVSPLITSCLDGYSVCILAYGQTGSGKTYSMEGVPSNPGLNQRALRLLLAEVSSRADSWEHQLSVSMLEIYNETLRDLLGPPSGASLDIKMSPGSGGELHVPGLSQHSVRNMQDINKILELGRKQRVTEHTNLNAQSSRSHALLILSARGRETSTGIRTTGKLYLVDLAGSERVSRSGAAGERLREAQCINRSLSALGDVFSALRSNQPHVPYRNSKLTYLLQEALSRDGKALLLVQVSPAERNVSESLCSLRFGDRVRAVELGAPTRRVEPSSSTETSESDTPTPRGARNTSTRRKAPSSVRHRIGPP